MVLKGRSLFNLSSFPNQSIAALCMRENIFYGGVYLRLCSLAKYKQLNLRVCGKNGVSVGWMEEATFSFGHHSLQVQTVSQL